MSVRSKQQMYRLLAGGAFGNTIRQYFDVDEWLADQTAQRCGWWGVRSLTPGGPCRLFCPREEVATTVADFARMGHRANISLMIDTVRTVTLWADVYDSPTGLQVYGIEHPPAGSSWRSLMPSQGKQHRGVTAHQILRRHLNEASLADLEALREQWPGHVYELSACDLPIGTVPGRNAVLWEVRDY